MDIYTKKISIHLSRARSEIIPDVEVELRRQWTLKQKEKKLSQIYLTFN